MAAFFDEQPAAAASTSASPTTRMGNDLNIEHPEENGSGRIVQQIACLAAHRLCLETVTNVSTSTTEKSRNDPRSMKPCHLATIQTQKNPGGWAGVLCCHNSVRHQ
jgi:hypothetical protein